MTTNPPSSNTHPSEPRSDLDHSRRVFLLARAQLAAGRADQLRRDAAMRRWSPHQPRFN